MRTTGPVGDEMAPPRRAHQQRPRRSGASKADPTVFPSVAVPTSNTCVLAAGPGERLYRRTTSGTSRLSRSRVLMERRISTGRPALPAPSQHGRRLYWRDRSRVRLDLDVGDHRRRGQPHHHGRQSRFRQHCGMEPLSRSTGCRRPAGGSSTRAGNGRTCCGRSASSWWWLVLTSDRRPVGRGG